jgi:mono/diheme cytochrome c family protein
VRKGQDSLKADLDRVLDQLKPEINTLADKYGFPLGRPVNADGQRGMVRPPEPGAVASSSTADGLIRLGRSLFNQHCSHCHAPNAMSPEPTRDLRRLALRYGVRMRETAYATITVGRVDKGMPAWKDLLGEEGIQNVLGFLESVQRQP